MNLSAYKNKKVSVTDTFGKTFSGQVCDYYAPEENESNQESIILECNNGAAVEFYPENISKISIVENL